MAADREHLTKTYRFALGICIPTVRWWGRLEVEGLECIPPTGPMILTGNHDSYWDPVVVGIAAIKLRQVRALAKSTLWKVKGLHLVLNGMRQIPVVRGTKDTDALERAMTEVRGGSCVGIFPEGTRSLGRTLRARSGVGRVAAAVPEAKVICTAVVGTTDIARFPKRPRLKVAFFEPASGQMRPGEDPADFAVRILAEMRALAPITPAGRRPKAIEPAPGQPAPVADAPDAELIPPAGNPST
jgi:1-acyl-sn-glycerol-3-phosphate acyltransferase